MSDCVKSKKLFLDALYHELNDEQQSWFDAHLEKCNKCAKEFAEAESVIKVMDKRRLYEPDAQYWKNYCARLSNKIENVSKPVPVWKEWWNSLVHILIFKPKLVYNPIAAVLLIAVGMFIGREFFSPEYAVQEEYNVPDQSVFESRIQKYLERSKVILSSIVNYDPATDDIYGLDFSSQKEVSRQLVKEAQYIGSGLLYQQREELLELILDLQLVLLKIIQFENGGNEFEIELLQSGIKSSALMLKINLEEIDRITRKGSF
ncbi:hypothetical protein AMJ80_07010 [bacterium SM23_31]|nr:MAG: hypothetical protein AMJ80_07010 [bacterium SM23_31]